MGPLQFLEPLVALTGALSAGLSAILSVALIATLLMPGVLVLLASTPGTGIWRWPVVWSVPSLVAVLLLGRIFPTSVEAASTLWWIAHGTYAAWAIVGTLSGAIHVLLRSAIFVFQPTRTMAPLGAFGKLFYGWGAAFCGSLAFISAAVGAAPKPGWQILWAIAIGFLSFLVLQRRKEVLTTIPANVATRSVWLAGAVLVGLFTPVALLFVVALIDLGPLTSTGGLSRGVQVAVVAVLLWAAGAWMMWRGRGRVTE